MIERWTGERRCGDGLSRSSQQRQDRGDEDSNRHRAQTEVVERDSAGQTGRRGVPCVHGDLSKDWGLGDGGFGTGDQTTKTGQHRPDTDSTDQSELRRKPAIPPPATWARNEPTESTPVAISSPPTNRTSDLEQGRSFRTERKECTRRANRAGWNEKSERGFFSVGNRFPARWRQDGLTRLRITETVRRPDLLRWRRSETSDSPEKTLFSPE